jgi:hypothetical protein
VTAYTFKFFRVSPQAISSQRGGYPSDAAAIKDARAFLARLASTTADRPLSVTIARGVGDQAKGLGAWDFDAAPRWSAFE